MPTVVLLELELAVAESSQPAKRRVQLNELLKVISVLEFDAKAADFYLMVGSS